MRSERSRLDHVEDGRCGYRRGSRANPWTITEPSGEDAEEAAAEDAAEVQDEERGEKRNSGFLGGDPKMAVTAAMVKELREMTGAGMMDCKKLW